MTEAKPADTGAPAGELEKRKIYAIFGGLMLAMLLAALDQTIVSTALPTIVGDLGGAEHITWVVTAYMLATTVTTPLWGKLGDLLGRKPLFILCVVIFLIGSALCGLAGSMWQLIGFRALQGVGGGGLIVLAQAIIGDVVSARERGRYQGMFGAVFGLASVAGPLLGGYFVDSLSWRWVFYVNLPIGAIALVVVFFVLPNTSAQAKPKIDYIGVFLLACAATSIVLVTSFGDTWGWSSVRVLGLSAFGVVCVVAFVFVEQRAEEPVIPLRLLTNRVFAVASSVSFVVGFAMFGAITFMPLFLQNVRGESPTESGLNMIPMMVGMLITSIGSGQLISRTGRYKLYPILGTAVFTVGLYLLSMMDRSTSDVAIALYLFVLGAGLGMVMQVLILAVQNGVEFRDLGTGTSGATFFRTIGSAVGVAVFGAVFNARLSSELSGGSPPDGALGRCSPDALEASPAAVRTCPSGVEEWFLNNYSDTFGVVFLVAVPIGALAFALTWLLPEVPLREVTKMPDVGTSFGMAGERSSLEELRLQIWRTLAREDKLRAWELVVDTADSPLSRGEAWMVSRVAEEGTRELRSMSEASQTPLPKVEETARQLEGRGLITVSHGMALITPEGVKEAQRLLDAQRQRLAEFVADYPGGDDADVDELLDAIARRLHAEAPEPAPA